MDKNRKYCEIIEIIFFIKNRKSHISPCLNLTILNSDQDKHCFKFTRCNRCVTFDYGPDCTPEQVGYDFDFDETTDEVICKEKLKKVSQIYDKKFATKNCWGRLEIQDEN